MLKKYLSNHERHGRFKGILLRLKKSIWKGYILYDSTFYDIQENEKPMGTKQSVDFRSKVKKEQA